VLQLPLDRATTASLQRQPAARCDVVTRRGDAWATFSMELQDLLHGPLADPLSLGAWFAARTEDRWAAYVIGVVQYCFQRAKRSASPPSFGLRIRIESTVPEGKGVSSSAAVEVATMMVVAPSCSLDLSGEQIATACQWVENHVVGAPCGIMDQMT